jgi:hypothetical protein
MASEIVPVKLGLTKGDLYTLWAPSWRDADDEWQGFLGKDDDLYAFESVADLVAFVRTNRENDLTDHPGWTALTAANAHTLTPKDKHDYDLVGVPEALSEKPSADAVDTLLRALSIVQSLGSVCDLTPVAKFFNGNPVLGSLGGGIEAFAGRPGKKRWAEVEGVIGRGWDAVLDAVDEVVSIPDVDAAAAAKAAAELDEPAPEPEEDELDDEAGEDDADSDDDTDEAGEDGALAEHAEDQVLGGDEDFWTQVGIDPIRIMGRSGTYYTLRCYLGDEPKFLGRNGRISVFSSERALARYLADEHESDLSELSTYDDIRTAATDGSLRIEVTDDNVYVLSGLSDDIADGADAVDREQLELAVELLRDVSDYAEDTTVDAALDADEPLGKLVAYALDPSPDTEPPANTAAAAAQWEQLETFVESRLRAE